RRVGHGQAQVRRAAGRSQEGRRRHDDGRLRSAPPGRGPGRGRRPGPDEGQGHAGQRGEGSPSLPAPRAAGVEVHRDDGRQGALRARGRGGKGRREVAVLVELVCIALMAVLVADVFLGVWCRYVMHTTFLWFTEVVWICIDYMLFLSAGVESG